MRTNTGLALVIGTAFGIGWLLGGRAEPFTLRAAPPVPAPASASAETSDYSRRVVAYIHGNIPITREDLGEYLIARYGAEKLDLLINKKIIEHACAEKNIKITGADIEADYEYLIHSMGVTRNDFVTKVLKQYRKTEYEWKEDVVRPRLMLSQFCKDRIQVSEEDLRKAFESQYGEKVDVQIILYPENQQRYLAQLYEKIRQSDEAFTEEARKQPDSNLAMTAGRVKPIARYSGIAEIEKAAFSLKPGQVSEVFRVPEGWLILKCNGRVPADATVKFEGKREELKRQVTDQKIQQEIPKVFKELADKANPKRMMPTQQRANRNEQEGDIEQLILPK